MTVQGISFYDFIGKLIPGLLLIGLIPSLKSHLGESNLIDFAILIALAYIVGLIWNFFVGKVFGSLRRNKRMLDISLDRYIIDHKLSTYPTLVVYPFDILKIYDDAYYLIMRHNMLGTIPIQEANENFLRNIWPIVVMLLIAYELIPESYIFQITNSSQYWFLLLLMLTLLIPVVWYRIQMKIYDSVWDSAYWTILTHP